MPVTTIQVVHGFAVASAVFRPLLHELTSDSVRASLIRYPSVGLGLDEIVSSLAERLRADPPDAIVAHSLGGFATWLAVAVSEWRGAHRFIGSSADGHSLHEVDSVFSAMAICPVVGSSQVDK
ncbi:MAG: hypothetical protein AAGG48_25605 [Planctomycetota bacterium]